MTDARKHIDWIDTVKGMGIILVIMGHTIFPIHEAISIFHMPLFFFIAGVTLKVYKAFDSFLLKKINRIFIPYLFFSFMSWGVARLLCYSGNVFNGPLWFLHCLFCGIIITQVILKYISNHVGLVLLFIVLYGWLSLKFEYVVFPYDKDFDLIIRSTVFILAGYCLQRILKEEYSSKVKIIIAITLFLSYLLLVYVSVFKLGAKGSFLEGTICQYNIVAFYMSSLVGILTFVFASRCIKVPIINWLGKHSLVVMCVHYPFLQWWNPMISSLSFYVDGGLWHKGMIALLSYAVALLFSCLFIPLCKRLVPKFTGYKPLLSVQK